MSCFFFFSPVMLLPYARLPLIPRAQQEYFKFPDVAICASFLEGCLSQTTNCYEDTSLGMYSQSVSAGSFFRGRLTTSP